MPSLQEGERAIQDRMRLPPTHNDERGRNDAWSGRTLLVLRRCAVGLSRRAHFMTDAPIPDDAPDFDAIERHAEFADGALARMGFDRLTETRSVFIDDTPAILAYARSAAARIEELEKAREHAMNTDWATIETLTADLTRAREERDDWKRCAEDMEPKVTALGIERLTNARLREALGRLADASAHAPKSHWSWAAIGDARGRAIALLTTAPSSSTSTETSPPTHRDPNCEADMYADDCDCRAPETSPAREGETER